MFFPRQTHSNRKGEGGDSKGIKGERNVDGVEIVRELRGRGMWMWEIFGWAGGGGEDALITFQTAYFSSGRRHHTAHINTHILNIIIITSMDTNTSRLLNTF